MIQNVITAPLKNQFSIEENVKQKFTDIRSAKIQLKENRKMLKDAFEGDSGYKEINDQLTVNKQDLKIYKQRMVNENPALTTLQDKIDSIKEGLKSHQLTLSDYLLEYTKKTGNDTIPDDTGEIVKIKVKKVVKVEKI